MLFAGLLTFLIVRGLLIPRSFGEYGFYRADNVKEQMDKPIHFGSKDVCSACHDAIWNQHQKGVHVKVPCQDCHAPVSTHVDLEKGEFVDKMRIQKTSKLCLRCHTKLPSRPVNFPQIDVETHLEKVPNAHQTDVCFGCHNPHDPRGKRHGK